MKPLVTVGILAVVASLAEAQSAAVLVPEAADTKPSLVLDPGGHTGAVRSLAFTPDGKELISSSWDQIRIWNVKSGDLVRVVALPKGSGGVTAISPDGHLLAVRRKYSARLHGIALMALPEDGSIRNLLGHSVEVVSLAFSPDGRRLASADGGGLICIWDVASGRRELSLIGHRHSVEGLAFSPEGRRLASCSFDQSVRIWNLITGRAEAILEDRDVRTGAWNGIAWSPDGRTLVTGCFGALLRVWNTAGTLRERHGAVRPYRSMVFTKDSKAVLFAAARGGFLFDLEQKRVRAACTRVRGEVWCVALSPDERVAATGGAFGEDLHLWSTADGSVLHRLAGAGRTPRGAAWSPDGKAIAWGWSGQEFDWKPDALHLRHPLERSFDLTQLEFGPQPRDDWRRAQMSSGSLGVEVNFQNGFTSGWIDVKEGTKSLITIQQPWTKVGTFLPGERLVLGGNGLKLYQARTGQLLRSFEGGAGYSLAPSPDNRYLLASRGNQTLTIWRLDQDMWLLTFFVAGDDWIVWTPEGYYAASPGGERLMGWQIENGLERLPTVHPAVQFRKTLYRPDVIRRVLQAGSVESALRSADAERGKNTRLVEVGQVLPPQVRIMTPDRARTVREGVLEVRARATSSGIHPVTTLQLMLDGRPLLAGGGAFRVPSPRIGDVETSWSITLTPGKHRLAVRADSAVSGSLSEEVEINYVAPDSAELSKLPSLYVLAIGISDYPADLKLNYAAKDARVLAEAFQKHSKRLYDRIVVKELTNAKATQREILQGISWLKKQPTQRDVAVLFFAGHGDLASDGSMYLMPVDVDPGDLEATGVSAEHLKSLLTGFPCRVIFMLDACHAGGIDGGTKRRGITRSLTDDLIRDLVTDERGVIALCASTGRQFALESNEHRHGLFTLALVEGLQGRATKTADGVVYLHHLDAYVTDRVRELSQGRQSPTTARPASIRSFPLSRP